MPRDYTTVLCWFVKNLVVPESHSTVNKLGDRH
jgi:hypothetical protein